MDFLQEWVTQIIIFLLVAMFVELLLPQSSMQKYIKFAVGLILVLIFLQPLFHIFNADAARIIEESLSENTIEESNQVKKTIENEKREIQASQRAYILNQTVVQLKEQAEEELVNKYGVTIADISFNFPEDSTEVDWKKVEQINVKLKRSETSSGAEVDEVVIDFDQEQTNDELPMDEIKNDLSSSWEISKDKINLIGEGGEQT